MHKVLDGKPFVPALFDSYMSTAMLPDDLVT